ncbi:MAG: hypothetical protein ACYDCL_13265 [Myxococcales bacterium]
MAEDAFIGFRIIRTLWHGQGPLYNVGERVEAYSNPLWLALLAALGAPLQHLVPDGALLPWLSVVLGLGFTFVGVAAAGFGARRLARLAGETGPAFAFGGFLVAAVPAFWGFASSGLETGFAMAFLGGSFWLLSRLAEDGARASARLQGLAAFVCGLGVLIRPDLALYSFAFLAAELWLLRRGGVRSFVRVAVWGGALPVAYQLFRMGYFACLVANTALAKEAGAARWDQGVVYLRDFLDPYLLWIPLALVFQVVATSLWDFGRSRRWDLWAVVAAPAVTALLQATFVVRVGGDFMHGRMLLPAWFAFMLPVGALSGRKLATLGALLFPWAIGCAFFLRVPYADGPAFGPHYIADERLAYVFHTHHANPVTLDDYDWDRTADGRWLAGLDERPRPPGTAFFSRGRGDGRVDALPVQPWVKVEVVANRDNIGTGAFAAGPRVAVDDTLGGLSDPVGARLSLSHRDRPGHEKWLPFEWVLARYFEPMKADSAEHATLGWNPEWLEAAHAAYGCGDLRELRHAIEDPLTAGRFFENLWLSFRLTWLHISPDPTVARRELCR